MKVVLFLIVSVFFVFSSESKVNAQSQYDLLFQEFDARSFSSNEKRLVQFALSLSGDYQGLLDGKWGRISQTALEMYTNESFSQEPINLHLAALFADFFNEMDLNDWQSHHDIQSNLSFVIPLKKMNKWPRIESNGSSWSSKAMSYN
jgi:serine protease Do